ncbi:hypothetical protein, partial [aff. Roholtiella sp. LEGE 12411]|uniref:hypothetical protein n=1 Tax=aff. Roholtiella sp. LEGE 12411 TaxID=1828822 RepID=UPI001ABC06FB
ATLIPTSALYFKHPRFVLYYTYFFRVIFLLAKLQFSRWMRFSSTLSIFFATRSLSLKPLCDGSFTFLTSSIICDVEKVFAKKPGFLPNKEIQVFNFG